MSFETDFKNKNAELEVNFKDKNAELIDFIVEVKKQKTSFEDKNFETIIVKLKTLTIETNLLKIFESICDSKIN